MCVYENLKDYFSLVVLPPARGGSTVPRLTDVLGESKAFVITSSISARTTIIHGPPLLTLISPALLLLTPAMLSSGPKKLVVELCTPEPPAGGVLDRHLPTLSEDGMDAGPVWTTWLCSLRDGSMQNALGLDFPSWMACTLRPLRLPTLKHFSTSVAVSVAAALTDT